MRPVFSYERFAHDCGERPIECVRFAYGSPSQQRYAHCEKEFGGDETHARVLKVTLAPWLSFDNYGPDATAHDHRQETCVRGMFHSRQLAYPGDHACIQ